MNEEVTRKDLRAFGLVFTVALSIFGLWGVWRDSFELSTLRQGLLGGALLFLVLGLLAPEVLRTPRRVWVAFGEKIGHVVTTVLLSVFFFTAMTGMGLIRRMLGADSMGLKAKPAGESYWIPKENDGRGVERYESPF